MSLFSNSKNSPEGEFSSKYALDFTLADWQGWCQEKGFPKFAATQIYQWIFKKGILDPLAFTTLSLERREELKASFDWDLFTIDSELLSRDGSEKILLKTWDGLLIEMVVMPYENRSTLCLSCQVGCKMGCTFCQTGKMGLTRNLTAGEILYQLILARRKAPITNVVFMGMGEPLDNYEAVVQACKVMLDPEAFGLSKAKVTISTSGIIPQIERLGQDLPVRLAISLHSAIEEKRSKLMPVNRKYPLEALKKVLKKYPAPARYGITFEYVMIQGSNDAPEDAKALVQFLHGIKAKVNLIPINHFPGVEMAPSDAERIRHFQLYLTDAGIPAPVRYSKGVDVSGGCGQLAAKRKEEVDLDPRILHRIRRQAARETA